MGYSILFRRAWSFVRQRRILWLFGLLAALGGGGFNYIWNVGQLETDFELPLGTRVLLRQLLSSSDTLNSIAVTAVAIGIAMFMVHTFAEGALIRLVDNLERHQDVSWPAGLSAGRRHFMRLLIMRAVMALPLFAVAALTYGSALPALANLFTTPTGERLFDFGLITRLAEGGAAIALTGLLVAAISLGAARAIVLANLSIGQAIVYSFKLFVRKINDFVMITLAFVLYGFAAGLVFAVILAPILFASVLPAIAQRQLITDALTFDATRLSPVAIIAIVLAVIFGTVISTFTSAVWTLAYREWHGVETSDDAEG